jgi:hypothetical protein
VAGARAVEAIYRNGVMTGQGRAMTGGVTSFGMLTLGRGLSLNRISVLYASYWISSTVMLIVFFGGN